jgi:hypothetical protein
MPLGAVGVMGLVMTLRYGQESNRNRLIDPLSTGRAPPTWYCDLIPIV